MMDLIKFNQITNKDKLSQNTINSIIQDKQGFMWFGSQDGLNRYDGYNFKVYKKNFNDPDSISENFISCLFEDNDDNLWIGTYNSGLVMHDKFSDKFIKRKSLEVLSNKFISCLAEDNDKNLWIGTFHNGLFKLNKQSDNLEKVNLDIDTGSNKDHVHSLLFDLTNNHLYVGIWTTGLYIINLNNYENKFYCSTGEDENSLISNNIICLFKDSNRKIWIGTQDGLSKFCFEENKFESYLHQQDIENSITGNNIKAICESDSGDVWIGTYGFGMSKYNQLTNDFLNFTADSDKDMGFLSDTIFSLYADKSGVIWIGTLADGLLKLDSKQKRFFSIVNNDPKYKTDTRNKIRSIYVNNFNDILIGTLNDGLYHFKQESKNCLFQKHFYIKEKSVNDIMLDDIGNHWIASEEHGLCKINLNENTISFYDNILEYKKDLIFSISVNRYDKNLLLIGTESEGLKIYDIKNKTVIGKKFFPHDDNFEVRAVYFDSNNNLWVATHLRGLLLFKDIHISNENITKLDYLTFDCGNTVWCIYEDKENNIWVGTASEGLNRIDLHYDCIDAYTEENGLCNNCILGILEDNNDNLWLSTNNGLSKFNKTDKTFKNYDISDGLNNLEFNERAYFKHKDGMMYFGGNDGITYFHPDEITDNPYIPNVVLTDFEIFNETVHGSPDNPFLKKNITYADEINLTYRESVFSFKFAALIFNNPQKNQYAYKMEGFDKDWTYCGTRRRVTYTNLDPGTYIFRVKGSNNDALWNEEGASIKINISPPYWKTWWFKSLSLLGLVSTIGYSYKQRLEKLEKESKAQEEFSRKLIEVQELEKKRIASELHDTIAQEITISKNKALIALKHKDDKKRLEDALAEISDMATSTITNLRNIAYDLRPHQLDKLGFTRTLKATINEISKSTNINFEIVIDDVDDILSKETEINLFRVIQESISNIMNHSKATEAIINVSKLEKHLLIIIIDNGKGFDVHNIKSGNIKHGFGFSSIAERIKFMKGEMKIDSEIDKGTTLRFKVPINK